LTQHDVDINRVLIKPIYIGLLMNIFIPLVILLAAYYIDSTYERTPMLQPEELNLLFWVLAAISIVDGVIAIILKQKMFYRPMVSSKETFEEDLINRGFAASIVCFALTTAISIYGLVFFILGGTFTNLLFFVFISFIAFQLIRPRHGFIQKVIEVQGRLVNENRFYQPKK